MFKRNKKDPNQAKRSWTTEVWMGLILVQFLSLIVAPSYPYVYVLKFDWYHLILYNFISSITL